MKGHPITAAIALAIATTLAAAAAAGAAPAEGKDGFDLGAFGALPVLDGGRSMPIDTFARNSLLLVRGKQYFFDTDVPAVFTEGGLSKILSYRKWKAFKKAHQRGALEWLLATATHPEKARTYKVFRIDNGDVLALIGKTPDDGKYYSLEQIEPHIPEIQRQARAAPRPELRNHFQRALVKLHGALITYQNVRHCLPIALQDSLLEREYRLFESVIEPGRLALDKFNAGEEDYDTVTLERFAAFVQLYGRMAEAPTLPIVPPPAEGEKWQTVGQSLVGTIRSGALDPATLGYAKAVDAYIAGDVAGFNTAVSTLGETVFPRVPEGAGGRVQFEKRFNDFQPFYRSMVIYLLVFLAAAFSWIGWQRPLANTALVLAVLAFGVHSAGLLSRMYIQGRLLAPVTNLYSSAVFIGVVAVFVCLLVEYFFRRGIATAVAAVTGFSTLVIAHHLGKDGDTIGQMQAVLDSNFWLATHVPSVTVGYAATFLGGFLAIAFILAGVFTTALDRSTARTMAGIVYGVTCFALLFSFVGTILGGIWADQSWGRFWGWDPKENGALMIVIWNAVILHARWGGIAKARGIMCLAVVGNIVTSWSWFGTNLLGIGLHAYGFKEGAFQALFGFWASQVLIIAIGCIPTRFWRSSAAFDRRASPPRREPSVGDAGTAPVAPA